MESLVPEETQQNTQLAPTCYARAIGGTVANLAGRIVTRVAYHALIPVDWALKENNNATTVVKIARAALRLPAITTALVIGAGCQAHDQLAQTEPRKVKLRPAPRSFCGELTIIRNIVFSAFEDILFRALSSITSTGNDILTVVQDANRFIQNTADRADTVIVAIEDFAKKAIGRVTASLSGPELTPEQRNRWAKALVRAEQTRTQHDKEAVRSVENISIISSLLSLAKKAIHVLQTKPEDKPIPASQRSKQKTHKLIERLTHKGQPTSPDPQVMRRLTKAQVASCVLALSAFAGPLIANIGAQARVAGLPEYGLGHERLQIYPYIIAFLLIASGGVCTLIKERLKAQRN